MLKAADVAEKLCDSVAASLLGKKQGSFTRISSTVQVYLCEPFAVLMLGVI
jgi:signal recognition particle receptor subunit alpha